MILSLIFSTEPGVELWDKKNKNPRFWMTGACPDD
jgi:hypothetical protein